jgi:uncharacterized phage infection (PIP) family protein YhgE
MRHNNDLKLFSIIIIMSLLPINNNSLVSSSAQRYITLLQEFTELKTEHDQIKEELEQLKKDCEENTIISSMNDMKKDHEIQEKKIEKLKTYINEMNNYTKTVKTMISVISTNISDYTSMRSFKLELRTRLEFIMEILDSSLKRKNELLYYDL